jgi:hypothetical protein
MKTLLLRLAAIFGLSIGALALPTTAFAGGGGGGLCGPGGGGEVMTCHVRGLLAEASYQAGSWDTTATFVSIGAMKGTSVNGGPPTDQSAVYITISRIQADPSNPYGKPMPVVELYGYAPVGDGFSIDRGLGSATLSSVAIPVYGFDQNGPVNGDLVTVNASWSGIGAATRTSSSFSYKSGDFMYRESFRSTVRGATTVSSAAEGATDWISGLSPTYADLQSASDAVISITHA